MKELETVLSAFLDATKCDVTVWQGDATAPDTRKLVASTSESPAIPDKFPNPESDESVLANQGTLRVAAVRGIKPVWLAIGPCANGLPEISYIRLLSPIVAQALRGAIEADHATSELADRYEEINLLYTIGEILGRTVTLAEAAKIILTEISEIVGARTGAILVHDPGSNELRVVASLGDGTGAPTISVDDPASVSARVFRTQHPQLIAPTDPVAEQEASYRRGEMLSVPIMWTTPEGGEPLGVVNLSGRRADQNYSAGDQKLVRAIATQIGTAIQNARLVRASVEQEQLLQEMHLAHDLQMKLLPSTDIAAPSAQVAARVVPAESVGGDFYHLFKLSKDCTGVMIGDVSGHGYRAALIMALVMSASAIHAQNKAGPGEMLSALLASLKDELETTEMYISVFYGVIDHASHVIRYANAGHPHAFVYGATEKFERLRAIDPPLGMSDSPPVAASYPWRADHDLLVMFTDGIGDARNRKDERLGEDKVLNTVLAHKNKPVDVIVRRVFEMLEEHMEGVPTRDDLTLVVVRS